MHDKPKFFTGVVPIDESFSKFKRSLDRKMKHHLVDFWLPRKVDIEGKFSSFNKVAMTMYGYLYLIFSILLNVTPPIPQVRVKVSPAKACIDQIPGIEPVQHS